LADLADSGPEHEGLPPCRGGKAARSLDDIDFSEHVLLDESVLAGMGSGCKGIFITFEGLDGSGKSTQMELLAQALRASGYEVLTTREPGGTPVGEDVRAALLDPENRGLSGRAEALLYAAARAQLVEQVIRPELQDGKVVLCDRYVDSSLAYQGYARGLGFENMITLNMWATDGLMPDLTLVLRITEEERARRLSAGREASDRLESEGDGFFQQVAQAYERLIADYPHRIRGIDAGGLPEEVHRSVLQVVQHELDLVLQV
jgi:dTMP kinase